VTSRCPTWTRVKWFDNLTTLSKRWPDNIAIKVFPQSQEELRRSLTPARRHQWKVHHKSTRKIKCNTTEIATVRYRSRRYNARCLIPALYLVRKEVLVEHWAVTPHNLERTMESVLDTEWFLHPEFAYPSGRLAACSRRALLSHHR